VSIVTISERVRFIESVFGVGNLARNSKNIEVRCPACSPLDKNKKKLAIRIDDDRNHCWVCGWHAASLAPLLKKYSSQEKFNEYRQKFMPEWQKKRFSTTEEKVEKKAFLPDDFCLLTTSRVDRDVSDMMKYLQSRNITKDDMWRYRLGLSDDRRLKRRIIVPSFDSHGELNYYVARAIDLNNKPKYVNPEVDRLTIVFNEIDVDWTKRVVLCEGAFDMFKCGDNAIPILGSELNERSLLMNMLLLHNTPVLLALDGDVWETKTIKIAKKLCEYAIDTKVIDTRPFSDPGSSTKEQFNEALSRASVIKWEDAFQIKLNKACHMSMAV
jgi:hypothetical protein